MSRGLVRFSAALVAVAIWLATTPTRGEEPFEVPLENASFTKGVDAGGVPRGWSRYGSGSKDQELKVVAGAGDQKLLLIADGDPAAEIGVSQTVKLQGGKTYEVTLKVRAVEQASTDGAYVQFRFLPSQQLVQTGLAAESTETFAEVSVRGTAPPDTTQGVIYLYTHRTPTPRVLVTDVRLVGGLPPPPAPPPAPVPPQYDKLKDPGLDIRLVKAGQPNAAIVVPASGRYRNAAAAIQRAIANRTGVQLPIASDDAPEAAVPVQRHLVVLGNRSTNKTLGALYDRYYCLVDLKYPGPEGYVLRSVHDPFGNGCGVVIVGGSDDAGVEQGAAELAGILAKGPPGQRELSLGWTMATKLGRGVRPPTDIQNFETWEASQGYGSSGYFGWCSISKRMAMYYMTGDEFNAREVVRLAFPDQRALRDLEEIDGERIENKRDPLAGFYHYNAHLAILFWDLIEESPVFTDEERLKITNAFARQLNHRRGEGVYGLTQPPGSVSSRHGQWSAISLYCLGRYFQKHYPNPIWEHCVRAGELAFQALHKHAWVAGESDNLFWYNTGIAPILTYLVLTGDRKPLENGVLAELLRGQETLCSGRVPDWALNSAAVDLLHKAAYLTGDGRWLTYRERTGVDTNVFRLGQSFWPDATLTPKLPTDLVGKWSIQRLPKPAWNARGSGLPAGQSFYFGSYRSAADATGDYILLDGFNGASRNPYHTFDILELRLDGQTILQGYHNQVLTSADGLVEPLVAMDSALLYSDVVGPTATAVGEVPKAAFCNWRRTLAQRTGRYALIVDDLTFRTASQNMTVSTTWQVPGGRWDPLEHAVRIPAGVPARGAVVELRACDLQETSRAEAVTMNWHGAVKPDEHRRAFYLIGQQSAGAPGALACFRLADNAAALALPQTAVAVVGAYAQVQGALVIVAQDHLYGHALTQAGIGRVLVSSDTPIELDWDFTRGVAHVVANQPAKLALRLKTADELRLNGEPVPSSVADAICKLSVPVGRHTLTGAWPAPDVGGELVAALQREFSQARRLRAEAHFAASGHKPAAAELPAAFTAQVGGKVVDLTVRRAPDGEQLGVAEGNTIHLLTHAGKELRKLTTDGPIRVLHWWGKHDLLLAGCVDERVSAFDREGRRQWVFTSEMDHAVYEAAKTYWFKSAPGHAGIHGLDTGVFDEGQERCFVGSACTLEILNQSGQLVKRMPVFWGPCWKFLLVPDRDGSRNLLVAQWPNGSDSLALVNSKTLAEVGRGFEDVPAGHSYVGGWTAQNRTGLIHADLNGDGQREVATAINGTWNRVTVYTEQGRPLHNAQFGPGPDPTPRARLRGLDAADLDGDGRQELVVGLSEGLIVALSHDCQKRWATRLSSPPTALLCVKPLGAQAPRIVAGCEDGAVAVLDNRGVLLQVGKVSGRPAHIAVLTTAAGPVVVLATDRGTVAGFRISE